MTRVITLLSVVLACAVASGAMAKDKFYRWTDENGVVHYSATPPDGVASAELTVSGQPKGDSVEPAEGPTEEDLKAEDAKKLDAANAAVCDRARASLRVLEYEPTVVRIDRRTGEKRTLSASEYEAAVADARDEVRRACGPDAQEKIQ